MYPNVDRFLTPAYTEFPSVAKVLGEYATRIRIAHPGRAADFMKAGINNQVEDKPTLISPRKVT
jgi:hypothetical protein